MPVKPQRFLDDLHQLRRFGAAGPGKGVARRAFSAADIEARLWLIDRFRSAGLRAQFDPAGNVWGLSPKRGLLLGSHTDSQPEGGWLDGALGVMAGLEIARGRDDVSVVSFQDEEGRFGALTGSDIWSGALSLEEADQLSDASGITFAKARLEVPQDLVQAAPEARIFEGYLELHIEQGPVLDAAGLGVGVVTAIVGARQKTVTLTGAQNHAGTTPMPLRKDAVRGFSHAVKALEAALAVEAGPATVWTIGQVDVHPNAASIVPGKVTFTLQWRDPDEARLARLEQAAGQALMRVAEDHGLRLATDAGWALRPTPMDDGLRSLLVQAAETKAPGQWRSLPSGALHDASNVARLLPVAMLFAPSIGGISHDFAEDTAEDDLIIALKVLDRAVASRN